MDSTRKMSGKAGRIESPRKRKERETDRERKKCAHACICVFLKYIRSGKILKPDAVPAQ